VFCETKTYRVVVKIVLDTIFIEITELTKIIYINDIEIKCKNLPKWKGFLSFYTPATCFSSLTKRPARTSASFCVGASV
jgi:hypothetical protein